MRASMRWAAAILVAAAATGCAERGGSGPVAKTGVEWLDRANTPVNVTLAFDSANASSETIGEAGGSVSATGSDGSYFQLEIPKGALHQPVKITMIPVSRVDGLPLEKGGAVATVQLEPEGLRFDRPVKLTIEPAHAVPEAERVGFAYVTHGTDTHLYPAKGDSLEMEMQLLHFSGYGFGQAPPSDPGRIHLLYAASHLARLEAELARAAEAERQRALQLAPENAEESAKVAETFRRVMDEYFDAIVLPTMKIAETDDRMAECALRYYIDWRRHVELLGMAPSADGDWNKDGTPTPQGMRKDPEMVNRITAGAASLDRIMDNVESHLMQRAMEGCKQHDLAAYNRVIAFYRTLALLGGEGKHANATLGTLNDKANDQCNRWEVELSSSIDSKLPSGTWHFTLTSTAKYAPTDGPQEAPLNYASLEVSGRPWRDIVDAASGGKGDVLLQKHEGNFLRLMDFTFSKRGSRHGTVTVSAVSVGTMKVDTVGITSCKGANDKEARDVADSMDVTLRIDPPTEIVHMVNDAMSNDAEMHEWMRFFINFRKAAGHETTLAPGANPNDDSGAQPEFVTVRVKAQSPGVWSADFRTPPGAMSDGLSETGHLILRHTPQ